MGAGCPRGRRCPRQHSTLTSPLRPGLQEGLGAYSFIIFAVICLLTTIYIALIIPETKNKTFIEINQTFAKMNKVSAIPSESQEMAELPSSTSM